MDNEAIALVVRKETALVLAVDLDCLLLGLFDECVLLLRDGHIGDGDGDGALRGVLVAEGLDAIEHLGGDGEAVTADALVDDDAEFLLADEEADLKVEQMRGIAAVHEAEVLRDRLVEDQAADRRRDDAVLHHAVDLLAVAHADGRMQADAAVSIGRDGLIDAGIGMQRQIGRGALLLILGLLDRGFHKVAVDELVHGKVKVARIGHKDLLRTLLLLAKTDIGQVVGTEDHILRRHGDRLAVLRTQQVVCGEHQHTGLSLGLCRQRDVDRHLVAVEVGVEGSAAQRVQLQGAALDQHRLKGLNAEAVQRRRTVEHDGAVLDDVLEGIPDLGLTLVDLLLGALDVVGDTVLDELLHDKRAEQLNGHFLRHAALIELQLRADDNNRTAGIVDALAQQVLAEAALLALEHVGQGLQRTVVRTGDSAAAAAVVDEGIHGLLQHALFVADNDIRRIELDEALEAVVSVDDAAVEVIEVGRCETTAVELNHRADVRRDDRQDIHDHPLGLVAGSAEGLGDLEPLDDAQLLLAAGVDELAAELAAQGLEIDLGQQLLHGLGAHTGLEIVLILFAHVAVFFFRQDLALAQGRVAGIRDDIVGKIQDLLQNARADVQQQAHTGGDALEIPDVAARRGQLDVAHALAAHLAPGDLDAAAIADLALEADLLILAAVALPVLRRSEDALAVQAVALGLQGAVVDGLRLFDLAVRPVADHFRRSNADFDRAEGFIAHRLPPPYSSSSGASEMSYGHSGSGSSSSSSSSMPMIFSRASRPCFASLSASMP